MSVARVLHECCNSVARVLQEICLSLVSCAAVHSPKLLVYSDTGFHGTFT